ncbi:MAG: C45 family autoproteolytic acyltransferase/hydrolase [Candidatus Methanofastidiosia archaeon]
MYHNLVKGTYYNMGFKYGSILYKHGFRISEQSSEKLNFGRKSEKEVKRIFPDILEEIKGFADACHASYEQMIAFMFSIGAFKVEPMCSVFAAFNGSNVVFGRNYDFFYSFKKYTESYLTCPDDGYFSIGHTDVFIGREDGVNEKGLAIGMTEVDSEGNKPGISFVLALRCVLDKCSNVKEGVKILSDACHTSTFNFLLADREGSMAVVEASPERVRVRRPEEADRFLVTTNHFVHPEMLKMENVKERCWDSIPRYKTIYNTLRQQDGKIDIRSAQKILSNHSGYVCSHQKSIQLGTLWSIITNPKNLQIFRAEGHPCRAKYRQDVRLDKAMRKHQGS